MNYLHKIFGMVAAGMALTALCGFGSVDNAHAAEPARRATPNAVALKPNGPAVIDLSANADDLSPAVNHIVTRVQEALAANQKIIVMVGEEHTTIADVRLGEFLRQGLARAGISDPVMALEISYNSLEKVLPDTTAFLSVESLKNNDPVRYRQLMARVPALYDWDYAPLSRHENFSSWFANAVRIRMVDLSFTEDYSYLDYNDAGTAAFIDSHISSKVADKTRLSTTGEEGIRLRNLWMAAQLRDILAENDNQVVILIVGAAHLAGDSDQEAPYAFSLHPVLKTAVGNDTRIISVLSETHALSPEARAALDNRDMVILHGGCELRHWKRKFGSLKAEIREQENLVTAGGFMRPLLNIKSEKDYGSILRQNREAFDKEVNAIINLDPPWKPKAAFHPYMPTL